MWLASYTEYKVFRNHPLCNRYQYFIPFHYQIIFHCMDIPHLFIHSSVDRLFSLLVITNNAAVDILCTSVCADECFQFSWVHTYFPRNRITGLCGDLCLISRGTTRLFLKQLYHFIYSHQQCTRVWSFPHPCLHLLLTVFLLHCSGMKWYLTVVLIYAFPQWLMMLNILCVYWTFVYLLWRYV